MASRIQADYDRLAAIATSFTREAEGTTRLLAQVRRTVEQLNAGGWVGQGAEAFFREMSELVMPGVNRLGTSLNDASKATTRIAGALRQAEETAAALFRGGDGSGYSPRPGVPTRPPSATESDAGSHLPNDYFDDRRKPAWLSSAKPAGVFGFRSGNAQALKYTVTIEDQKIDVYAPANPDPSKGHFHSVQEVSRSLAALPKPLRAYIKSVYLEPSHSPDNENFARILNQPGFRSYMESGVEGVIHIYPMTAPQSQVYMDASFIHESGHVVSKQAWGTKPKISEGWAAWKDIVALDGNQVSKYGASEIQEDFCEALVNLVAYKGTAYELQARQLWGNRFRAIEKLVGPL